MWKYLIVNAIWFCLIFLVHFFGSKKDQAFILLYIVGVAALVAVKGLMDPIAWVYYVGFSLLVFYGAAGFKRWSFADLVRLKSGIETGSEQLGQAKDHLALKSYQTEFLETKADEIVEFYEQIKEMSKSLDLLETFLIFTEAMSEYFRFDVVKLAVFGETHPAFSHPEDWKSLRVCSD